MRNFSLHITTSLEVGQFRGVLMNTQSGLSSLPCHLWAVTPLMAGKRLPQLWTNL